MKIEIQQASEDALPKLKTADEISTVLKGRLSSARILQLAEAGYMPCWRVDGGPPLFVIGDVKRYVARHLMTGHAGVSFPEILTVPVAIETVTKAPPFQLSTIPHLRWFPRNSVLPGVYFLVKAGVVVYVGQSVVVYVGQSVNVYHRVPQHTDKDFDDVFFLPVPVSDLNEVELAFIRLLQPVLNSRANKMRADEKRNDDERILAGKGIEMCDSVGKCVVSKSLDTASFCHEPK